MNRAVVLVNSNRMKPPVAPLALDYVGGRLQAEGIPVELVDLTFADDAGAALSACLGRTEPIAVGITFRNTDDCLWPSGAWFVPQLQELVALTRSLTSSPIVLGGCGFSIFPAEILDLCGADYAIVGDGEEAMFRLVRCLECGGDPRSLPGLGYRDSGVIRVNPPAYDSVLDLPTGRSLVDNPRYLRTGGMGNVETKRGCPSSCVYCADPLSKGSRSRCRPPAQVADEIESLCRRGVDVLHLCDSEFNLPGDHAMAVCLEIHRRGIGDRFRWYCYMSPVPFSVELAQAMRLAGCVGINFGADHASDRMLASLGRGYRHDAIADAVQYCRQAGITVMLDLLFGAPGENRESIRETIDFVKRVNPDRAGAAIGVRLYPRTQLTRQVLASGPMAGNPNLRGRLTDNDGLLRSVFYIQRELGDDPARLVADLIGHDERFFLPLQLDQASSYNYNDNTTLTDAIAQGHRGAFWDILRKLSHAG